MDVYVVARNKKKWENKNKKSNTKRTTDTVVNYDYPQNSAEEYEPDSKSQRLKRDVNHQQKLEITTIHTI